MDDGQTDHLEAEIETVAPPVPRWGAALVVAWIGLVVCSNIAAAVWARWQNTNPEGLLALSARVRYLLISVNRGVEPLPYAVIGFVRLLVAALVCYGIGVAFGIRVLTWFQRFLGVSRASMDRSQGGFTTASWILVPFFAGSNIICALAGVNRMPWRRFLALVSFGIAARLALYWYLADVLEKPLDAFLDFVSKYQRPFLIGSIALVVLTNANNLRKGRR